MTAETVIVTTLAEALTVIAFREREIRQLRLDLAQQTANVAHYKAMFESAVVSMDSCACQWEPQFDDPAKHTDRITTLCLAHQEYFDKQRALDVGEKS